MIDFDYNATTPLKNSVREEMDPFLEDHHGNPSSIHQLGQATKAAVEQARESIAESINVDPESLVITSSGSEANTLAIRGVLNRPYRDSTILTTPVEHSSVKDTVDWLDDQQATVRTIPLNQNAQLNFEDFDETKLEDVDIVSVMMVNNETGVRHDIRCMAKRLEDKDVLFHTDAVQAYGKVSLDFSDMPVDMMSIAAHKVGGPKGVGALIAPKRIKLEPLVFGGHQERDRRGGTENVPGVVGFGEAARQIDPSSFGKVKNLRNQFESIIKERLKDVHIVGESSERVANTSGLLVQGVEGEDVVMRMDLKGYAIATGAACTSGSAQPSHVIRALPLPDELDPDSFVRFSFSPHNTLRDVQDGAEQFVQIVKDLRETYLSDSHREEARTVA